MAKISHNHPLVRNLQHEPFEVRIDRQTKWGSPFYFAYNSFVSRKQCIVKYKEWLFEPEQDVLRSQIVSELKGKTLGCHCCPQDCHGDILARIANK